MNSKFILCISRARSCGLFLLAIGLFSCTPLQAQDSNESVRRFLGLGPTVEAIGTKFHVRTGLELALNDTGQAPVVLNLANATVTEVLKRLVEQRPDYTWKLQDNVYDVYPRRNKGLLLNLRIARYSVSNATVPQASQAIGELPEVKGWLARRKVRRREFETGSYSSNARISLTVEDSTLGSILDQLITKFQVEAWIISPFGDHMEFISINF